MPRTIRGRTSNSRSRKRKGTMDRENINLAVQALWLQYKGLTIEANRAWNRVDNAAYKNGSPSCREELPGSGAVMVAN